MKGKRKAAALALCGALAAAGAACAFLPCAACAAELPQEAAVVRDGEMSAAADAFSMQLPMAMTFQREDGLFVSRSSVGALPAAGGDGAFAAGDLLYLPESGRLAVVLRPGAAPAGSVRVGRMTPGRWMDAGRAELVLSAQ